ncbi:MAG: hypothetical protein KatS3mg094_539 [Candidatus Parcubacteria bacterium]|nr:MAG: hypothetical protein KatS3mg094_539 [Candidatus Parcubacteria bacterium]
MIDYLRFIIGFLFSVWWLILPLILWYIVKEKHLITKRITYRAKIQWIFLEIKIPEFVKKTPSAMEEIFYSLHAIYRGGDLYSKYILGFTPPFYVFEFIGHNGKLRFIIRCHKNLKDFVTSRIYSQYPSALIEEVEDPLRDLPWKIPNPTYNVFGTEFTFTKKEDDKLTPKNYYPIKTYKVWENLKDEEKIDPISVFSEGVSYLTDQEWIILQIMAMPVLGSDKEFGVEWQIRGTKEINKIMGRKEKTEPSPFEYIGEFIKNLLLAFAGQKIEWKVGKEDQKSEDVSILKLSPGEREAIESIERKISKPGYWCVVRFSYVAKNDVFSKNIDKNVALVMGTLKVFDNPSGNGIVRDTKTITSIDRPISGKVPYYNEKIFFRKRFIWLYTKGRFPSDFSSNRIILNTEEIASIYHIPQDVGPYYGIEKIPTKYIPPSSEVPEF